ncbi:Concanavalin A-like lectin/glucanase superfamily [Cynara cardunculus var. scolymus]|uniref:Xyloglucan endotransglucosylase/hydrolase n=1 Tax=Cynara cardunculus var. scolymus TaxID=59895 RepID=A0A118JU24_CYNCS|nr:Concanavalin A-like lectin/glucanase superfamily [Cynara cardunculus var. scolymus]
MGFLWLFSVVFILTGPSVSNGGYWPPSPGFYPSSKFRSMTFNQGFRNLWGPNHQTINNNALAIWLDRTSEFLGTTFGKPYTLQTNVYIRGSGDGKIIGREMKFHLWFDPTKNFHHYAILWTPSHIMYLRKSAATFPLRPMWLYGSIWDASSWATEDGKYKADYRYQPFVGRFTNFKASGCSAYSAPRCHPVTASPGRSGRLSRRQTTVMKWVQSRYMVYNYCWDNKRDHSLTPECWK